MRTRGAERDTSAVTKAGMREETGKKLTVRRNVEFKTITDYDEDTTQA